MKIEDLNKEHLPMLQGMRFFALFMAILMSMFTVLSFNSFIATKSFLNGFLLMIYTWCSWINVDSFIKYGAMIKYVKSKES